MLRSLFVYDESLAVTDTWFNQINGCNTSAILDWSCGLPCQKATTTARLLASNSSEKTLAIIGRLSRDECIVVFRGTKNIYNTLADLDFFPQALPGCDGCKVHSGFHTSWKSLEPQVNGHLSKLGCANGTVSVIGHSLGAAMAALAAYDLAEPRRAPATAAAAAKWRIKRVYTYGQPRVGNGKFAAAFDARLAAMRVPYARVVDYKDAVPHLPLANMFWEGWTHTGMEVYYNATRRGAYTLCALANDTRCSARWSVLSCLTHTCDHCSYLGMNPCDCGVSKPHCEEPHQLSPSEMPI